MCPHFYRSCRVYDQWLYEERISARLVAYMHGIVGGSFCRESLELEKGFFLGIGRRGGDTMIHL